MKTIPPPCPEPETGPKYWRSLDQLADDPVVRQWIEQEFPAGASLAPDGESRRTWMKLMSASFMFAGLGGLATGCRRPEEYLTPFAKQPEGYVHGKAEHFATSMPTRLGAVPLVARSHDGRPTKVEGNNLHPDSHGGTDLWAQASILDMYDPDRAHRHAKNGADVKIEAVRDLLSGLAKTYAANQGEGLVVLTGRSTSPSRARLQEAFKTKLPKAKWFVHEAVDFDSRRQALSLLFGAEVQPHYSLDKAKRILSLDCDFVGREDDAHRLISGFAKGRKGSDDSMNRLYAVESLMTLTGGQADHRLRMRPTEVARFAAQVGLAVCTQAGVGGEITEAFRTSAGGASANAGWVNECVKDLLAHKGASVVLAGYTQPLVVHQMAAAINAVLGAFGTVVHAVKSPEPVSDGTLSEAVAALNAGGVSTLAILGGNPAYAAPVDLDFPAAAAKAGTIVRLGFYEDETAALKSKGDIWQLAASHYLESWGDLRTSDGTVVPVQPLVEPLFGGLTEIEVLARLLGEAKPAPYELVRETLKALGADSEAAWKKFLHDGFLADSVSKPADPANARPGRLAAALAGFKPAASADYDVVLVRDSKVDDGRYTNNGWLMEMPEAVTKVTWENVILVSQKTAKALDVWESAHAKDGQYRQNVLKVTVAGHSVEGPVWVQPGMPDGTIGLALGYGRTRTGRVGTGCGYNAYALFVSKTRHIATGAKVEKVMRKHILGVTQEHGLMEGRPVIREANLAQFKAKPDFARNMDLDAHIAHYAPMKPGKDTRGQERTQNIYEHPFDQNPSTMSKIHQWGMVMDLSTCVGCSACVIACQSENNIPIVGKDQVARGREMHWMRIDRYYASNANPRASQNDMGEDPQMVVQPMFCQHCEAAPCESVCPVNATVHDEEGVNTMAYNRCIGTRYCANNCPYKVRRFNFFDYNKREIDYGRAQDQHIVNAGSLYAGPLGKNKNEEPEWEIIKLVKNPDVSVRMRGVMEKCTFCIQRIEQGKIAQKVKAGNSGEVAVPDGFVKTACQQACPADAITFGNILDPDSAVSKAKRNPRNYTVLGFLDNRPRVTYLARIRNPNPAMPDAKEAPESLRDYEMFRHENPFHESGHGHGPAGKGGDKHAAATAGKGAV